MTKHANTHFFRKALTTAIHLLLLSGCASTEGYRQVVSTWLNHSTDELITNWGSPTNITPLSDGGKVLQYVKARTESSGGYSYQVPRTAYSNANAYGSGGWATGSATTTYYDTVSVPVSYQQYVCTTNFLANSLLRITNVTFQGNDCRALPPTKQSTTVENTNYNNSSNDKKVGLGVLWE